MGSREIAAIQNVALALGPGVLYALLANYVMPPGWGTDAPRLYVTIVVALVLLSTLCVSLFRTRERKVVRSLHATLEQLTSGSYTARAKVHAGLLGSVAMSINKLATQLEQERCAHDGRTRSLKAEVHDSHAEQQNRSLYLANLSSELQGPLIDIVQTSQRAKKEKVAENLDPVFDDIANAGRSLLGTLSDLSDFSSIRAGKLEVQRELFGVHLAVKSVIGMHVFPAHEKDLKLKCKIARNVPYEAIGDDERFRQVLANFLDNAIKYTSHGEISVLATVDNDTGTKATIRLAVMDTGQGIHEEEQKCLFVDPTVRSEGNSGAPAWSGLGLAMCRDLAEMMGGTVGVESTPGKGSSFWFTVTVDKDLRSTQEKKLVRKSAVRDLPIMIVTDDPDLSMQILLELTNSGFACWIEDSTTNLTSKLHDAAPCGMVLIDGERPELIATMATWHDDGSARNIPVVGIPRASDRTLHRPFLLRLVHEWMGEEEEIDAPSDCVDA